jgi:hypothetical protein
MNRKQLLEAASQHLSTAIILLTAAGEDRLALDVEEIVGWLDFSSLPSDAKQSVRHGFNELQPTSAKKPVS